MILVLEFSFAESMGWAPQTPRPWKNLLRNSQLESKKSKVLSASVQEIEGPRNNQHQSLTQKNPILYFVLNKIYANIFVLISE